MAAAWALLASGLPSTAESWAASAFLLAAAMLAARFEVELNHSTFSAEFVPILSACLLVPEAAALFGLSAFVSRYPNQLSRIGNSSTVVIAAFVSGVVATSMGGFPEHGIARGALVCASAGAAFLFTNIALVVVYGISGRQTTLRQEVPILLSSIIATAAFNLPIVALIATAERSAGVLVLPLVLIPLLLSQYFHWLYHKKSMLTAELAVAAETLARTNIQLAAAMIRALDARDAYTAGHSAAVAVYCRDIAREAGFDDATVRLAHLAGLLHDIGKIGVPGRVLNATRPLTDDEYDLMKEHAAIGAGILGEVDAYSEISTIVRHHHERVDGNGYPDRIGGEFIPSISRMISVADTYSAMTTDRPYREGMPTPKAMSILHDCQGTQLDEHYTGCFLRILERESEPYRRGKLTDFEVEVAKHQALGTYEAEVLEKVEADSAITVPRRSAA